MNILEGRAFLPTTNSIFSGQPYSCINCITLHVNAYGFKQGQRKIAHSPCKVDELKRAYENPFVDHYSQQMFWIM